MEIPPLSQEAKERIFEEEIKPGLIGPSKPSPLFAYVLGLIGSGKSTSQRELKDVMPSIVSYDGDETLTRFSGYARYMSENDREASALIEAQMNEVSQRAHEFLSNGSWDTMISGPLGIHEGPFNKLKLARERLANYRDSGHRNVGVYVAAHPLESAKGIIERPLRQREQIGYGKIWPNLDYHDTLASTGPEALDDLFKNRCMDALAIVDRQGEVIYKNRLDSKGKWEETQLPGDVLRNEIYEAPWTKGQVDSFRAELADLSRIAPEDKRQEIVEIDRRANLLPRKPVRDTPRGLPLWKTPSDLAYLGLQEGGKLPDATRARQKSTGSSDTRKKGRGGGSL